MSELERSSKPSNNRLVRQVTENEKQQFREDGVVLLKDIYPIEWVNELLGLLNEVFDKPDRSLHSKSVLAGDSELGSHSDMVTIVKNAQNVNPEIELAIEAGAIADVDARSIVETDAAHWHSGLYAHHTQGPIPELVHQLTGSAKVNFYSDQLFLKEPGSMVKTPFHQDKPYFLVDGGDVAVVWIPVDTVTSENGAMGYVRGSHLWGKTYKPSDFITENGTFPEIEGIDMTGLEQMPMISSGQHDLVYFDVKPGDVIVHHWATIHGSSGNKSSNRTRRAASIRYACDGCRYFSRPSSPEPFRKTMELVDGDVLEKSQRFPVVWPPSETAH